MSVKPAVNMKPHDTTRTQDRSLKRNSWREHTEVRTLARQEQRSCSPGGGLRPSTRAEPVPRDCPVLEDRPLYPPSTW